MFPQDHDIPVRRLIQLWVAEGFILHNDSRIAEDVTEDYLDELINRSLIQVGTRRTDGGIKTCRIHDLLRELCISESKEEKALEVCRDVDILEKTKPRRLSSQCNVSNFFISSNKDISGTRSMLCFVRNSYYRLDSSKSQRLLKCFQLVRVLDLGLLISCEHEIPTNLSMFVHLKYLRIDMHSSGWEEFAKAVPVFTSNLLNLETLDLGRSQYAISIAFSSGIWKLKRLRHLHTSGPVVLREFIDVESKTLWNLQTLSCAAINKESVVVSLIGKGVFPKLRTLGLHFYEDGTHKQGVGQVWKNLPNLNHLNALKVHGFPDIPTSVNAFPFNITKLAISAVNLSNDVIITLGSLAKLRILKLYDCEFKRVSSSDIVLRCINGFPQLEVFQMKHMKYLYRWELGKDVMPCLGRLIIEECWRLTALPDELWSLTSLREVRIVGPSESLKKQLQSQSMRDGCKLIISKGF